MKGSVRRERSFNTAESEGDPRHVGKLHAPESGGPASAHTGWQSGKAEGRNFDMHVCRESDGLVVPTKRANRVDAYALPAESAEGRRVTKGNAPQAHSCRTQSRGCESQGLWRVRQAARRDSIRNQTSGWPSHEPEVRAV
jgi:hypothetical protein